MPLEPADEWLTRLFEDEYCGECGGDAPHHTAIPFMGNWFARCDYPSDVDGNQHPIIAAFREERAAEVVAEREARLDRIAAVYPEAAAEARRI